jgi:threonine dehydratase
MPHFAPLVKIKNCQLLGATVELFGDDFDTAKTEAIRRSETDGLCFIPPFDDPAIIAGQGTLAIEMLEDAPDLDAIFVPIGGEVLRLAWQRLLNPVARRARSLESNQRMHRV